MTGEEYIALTKKLIPVIPGRYEDIIRMTFDRLADMKCFKENGTEINLKIISSTSMLSEVVNTTPALTLIWDNYQWEIFEKFLLSALLYINKHKELSVQIYKMNIYAALSVRLTYIAPELSYLFAKRYRNLKKSLSCDFVFMFSSAYIDMLYCQLLALGHEFSHILFEQMDFGSDLYNLYQEDFFCIMNGTINSKEISYTNVNGISVEKLIYEIKKDFNKEYRKELICDIYSYILIGELIEKLDHVLNKERSSPDLYDDILTMEEFVLRTMDSFSYLIDFWTRFGSCVSTKRIVKPEDLHIKSPNFSIWESQYYARENLISLYIRVKLFRDRQLYVNSTNKKNLMLYNAISEMTQKLLTFEDEEWVDIICELQQLMNKNIPIDELIEARDSQLQFQ